MRANDIMTKQIVACGTLDSIAESAKIMYKNNVGCLAVLDEKDLCVGLVTDRDVVCGGVAQDLDVNTAPVTMIMERDFKSVNADEPLEAVVNLMKESGIRRVPVVSQGSCQGLISVDDLITRQLISLADVAEILNKQLSEPNPRHGLKREDEAA